MRQISATGEFEIYISVDYRIISHTKSLNYIQSNVALGTGQCFSGRERFKKFKEKLFSELKSSK